LNYLYKSINSDVRSVYALAPVDISAQSKMVSLWLGASASLTFLGMVVLNTVNGGVKFSFRKLKEPILSGNAVEGFYEYEQLKNRLYLWRPIKPEKELEEVFKALKIKRPQFDVK